MGFINPGRTNTSKIQGRKKPRKNPSTLTPPPHPRKPNKSKTPHPPPPTPSPSPLESLPTELVHKIFLEHPTLSLPATSRHLLHVLSSQSLYASYVRAALAAGTTDLLARRFFTSGFLKGYEARYGRVELGGCWLPVYRLLSLSRSGGEGRVRLFRELAARGARLDPSEREEQLSALHEAVGDGRRDVVEALVVAAGLKADVESLRVAVGGGGGGDREVMEVLWRGGGWEGSDGGARDVGVWKAALEVGGVGLRFLMDKGGVPPAEVLGKVGSLLG